MSQRIIEQPQQELARLISQARIEYGKVCVSQHELGITLLKLRDATKAQGNRAGKGFEACLEEIGISKTQAYRYMKAAETGEPVNYHTSSQNGTKFQQLADVPEKDFEEAISDPDELPSGQNVIDRTKKTQDETVESPRISPKAKAVWLWERIRDFDEMGFLKMNTSTLIRQLPDNMRQDFIRLAPFVGGWLSQLARELARGGQGVIIEGTGVVREAEE